MYEDSPEDLVHDMLQQRIWKGHPLGYIISGQKKIVRRVSRDEIIDFIGNNYTGDNIVISIAGNFNQKEILRLVEEEFGHIRRGSKKPRLIERPRYNKVLVKKNKDFEQLHVNIAFECISYLSEKRYILSVFNSILGGSPSSRLFQKIREEAGLTYSIYSYGSSYKDTGLLHIYAAMNPGQKDTVIKKIYNIVEALRKKGITADELSMTKEQIKTEIILGNESAKSRMNSNGKSMLFRGRIVPINELLEGIDKVSLEDVKDFAESYLDISRASMSMVGNIK
jgi:predicted Zn-dependent peptidase